MFGSTCKRRKDAHRALSLCKWTPAPDAYPLTLPSPETIGLRVRRYRPEVLLSAAREPNPQRKVIAVRPKADRRSAHRRPSPCSSLCSAAQQCPPSTTSAHRRPPVRTDDRQCSPSIASAYSRPSVPAVDRRCPSSIVSARRRPPACGRATAKEKPRMYLPPKATRIRNPRTPRRRI